MGLKALVTRWIEEWAQRELDARVEARVQAWAEADLKEQIGAYFDAEFRKQFDALPKADLKELLDAYFDAKADDFIEEKFDARFFTWADKWAGKNLQSRLDEHFDTRLSGRIDTLVQARVTNLLNDYIDRRIRQHLAALRAQADAGQGPVANEPQPVGEDSATPSRPAEPNPSDTLVTVSELKLLLGDVGIEKGRIREVLKGHEAVPGHTNKYLLGDAAARILLRKGKRALRKQRPSPRRRRRSKGSQSGA
ncbi:hypothetical protein GCM10010116_20150 [Microbispora rosea subsp. aerata]|nr:hypothetical protein [Microbispora rosea]GGO10028.1 hypothetical protein GCM10010116_20150 [Microbispora rosea subsp. aerata]GIH53371.1 hypothetical protein Mro02_02850 [Microbispora rosea subsp. aerata]GLJ83051.1 hypothetical protein GCM10017588_17770 [Microbispora rosea subsp. aerata]